MSIISRFRNKDRICEYFKCLDILGIYSVEGEYILESQLDSDGLDKCALDFYVDILCERLISEVPKVRNYNNVFEVITCTSIKALNAFRFYFVNYLRAESIVRIEEAIGVHLENTFNSISRKDALCLERKFNGRIGLEVLGYTREQKHIHDVLNSLREYKCEIVFYCSSREHYLDSLETIGEDEAFISDGVYFAYLSRVKVWLAMDNSSMQNMDILTTKILSLTHVFNSSMFVLEWKRKEYHVFHSIYYARLRYSHFILANTRREYEFLSKAYNYVNEKLKNTKQKAFIVKSGSPSLDYGLRSFKKVSNRYAKYYNATILLAPAYLSNLIVIDGFVKMIDNLLKDGYHVLFRAHPKTRDTKKDYVDVIEKWKEYKNFQIGVTDKWCDDSFARVGILITDYSSMGNSFPYIALVKSFFLNKNPGNILSIDGIEMYDSNTSQVFSDAIKAEIAIRYELNWKIQQETRKFIERYRGEQVYNLGSSGKFIADLMMRLAQE